MSPRRRNRSLARGLVALSALFAVAGAQASAQYVVQPAMMLDRNTAEFALWHSDQRNTDVSGNFGELRLRPTRDWEFAVTLGTQRLSREERVTRANIEARTLWRELDFDGYGAGVVFDLGYNSSDDRVDNGAIILPLTFEVMSDEMILVHLNAAADYLRDHDDKVAAAWGTGSEVRLTRRLDLIAEVFGEDRGDRPEAQTGLRWWIGDRELSLDASWRRTLESGANEIWTVGASLRAVRF